MTKPSPAQLEAARAYESLMVPALFGEWAPKIVDRVRIKRGERVLDLACGTGILAREVAKRTEAPGLVTGLDPNAAMLEVAKDILPEVEWTQGVAESPPFSEQTFDAVVSQFGLMFFQNRAKALRQAMKVLRPGGRLAIAVWDVLERNPGYADEVALLERLAGAAAADALRAPFVLGDLGVLNELFTDAGVAAVEVLTLQGRARFPDVRTMVEADLRGWLPVMDVVLSEEKIAEILEAAEHALRSYVDRSDGAVSFPTSAHVITARSAAPT